MRLKGKTALITAAASGIGRAAAVLFAREGAAVAVADIDKGRIGDTVNEIVKAGGRAHGIPCDLTREDDSKRVVREALAAFGGLDILWNNVGHPGPGRVEGVDLDDVDLAMNLNLRTVLITTAEAIPALRARGGGSILFTSSIAGIYGSPFSPVYSAAKFGVTGLTKSLSIRLAPDGIRVNCVCPAPIDTPMLDIFMGRPDVESNKHENLARMKQVIPLGRVGTPMEVAQAGLFLASDDASYITGVALPVDGGYTAQVAARPWLPTPSAFDPVAHRFGEARYFEDMKVGEEFYLPSRTLTEANFAAFQTVSGDNHPIHYDIEYCRRQGHPGLLAHGFQVLAQTAAGAGIFPHVVGESLIGFIEQSSRFLKPVYAGDTVYPLLTVTALTPGRKTGVITVRSTLHNQRGELCMEGEQKYLVRKRHPAA